MDFTLPEHITALSERVRAFVEDEVIPLEPQAKAADGLPPELLAAVRQKAKAAGLWAPQLPVEYGGQGLDLTGICAVFEQAGRSLLGPLALNCAAPDEGNMHLLHLAATPEQKEKYLRPVASGEAIGAYSLTEPMSGSDAATMRLLTEFACLLVLAVNGIASRVAFQTGFLDYLNDQGDLRMQRVMPHLQREYRTHGGWEHLRGDSDRWARLLRPDLGHGHEGPVPPLSDQTFVPEVY